jgi:hypothetical protein
MKYLFTILLCGVLTGSFAQETSKKDTVLVVTVDSAKRANSKKVRISIIKSAGDSTRIVRPSSKFFVKFTFSRFDLGLSKYFDNGSFTLSPQNNFLESETWKTSNVGFDLFEMAYRFNSYFKLYLSAGFDWNHMRLKNNITILPDQPALSYKTEAIDFKKNRFSSNYLRVPFGIQLRTKDDNKGKKVYFVAGPEVGFLLNGKVKQVSKEQGKEKVKDDYNFEPFRYGAYARLGYGSWGIYSKYYFNDVFAAGQGPADFKNLSFGLMIGF